METMLSEEIKRRRTGAGGPPEDIQDNDTPHPRLRYPYISLAINEGNVR